MLYDKHQRSENAFCIDCDYSGYLKLCVGDSYVRSTRLINRTINMCRTYRPREGRLIGIVTRSSCMTILDKLSLADTQYGSYFFIWRYFLVLSRYFFSRYSSAKKEWFYPFICKFHILYFLITRPNFSCLYISCSCSHYLIWVCNIDNNSDILFLSY